MTLFTEISKPIEIGLEKFGYEKKIEVRFSDFNKDSNQDIILAQNYFNNITGNELLNASNGVVLTYVNKNFKEVKSSGIKLGGEQNFVEIGDFNNDKQPDVIFSVNNNKSKIFIN